MSQRFIGLLVASGARVGFWPALGGHSFFSLFLAALYFYCCMQAFSSCGEQGLLSSCGV